jgi:hypothetical protein
MFSESYANVDEACEAVVAAFATSPTLFSVSPTQCSLRIPPRISQIRHLEAAEPLPREQRVSGDCIDVLYQARLRPPATIEVRVAPKDRDVALGAHRRV